LIIQEVEAIEACSSDLFSFCLQCGIASFEALGKNGLSRQWVGTLLARLQSEGWIEFSAPVLDHGMRGSTVFRIGRQVQRVLVMLTKSKPRKKSVNSAVKERWQFSPSKEEKKILQIREKELTPPPPQIFSKFPLLKIWLERGKDDIPKKEDHRPQAIDISGIGPVFFVV
jgi:hypothetical protein